MLNISGLCPDNLSNMKSSLIHFLCIFYVLLISGSAMALAPVESLVLGNFSEDYSENKSDPLNYVFSRDASVKNASLEYKKELAVYRGFYEEGKNTANYCKESRPIHYATEWEKVQVKRSMLSLIQYIGLDITTRALPQYAKALEFTRDEYTNMVDGLVGNYCSTNLSVISKRELVNNFILKYDKENNFKLPSVAGNPYYPDNLDSYLPPKKAVEQEFLYTVKLFQALCSWSGNPSNPGLMVPILKNSALMSFFARQMSNQSIGWREIENTLYLKEDKQTVQVWCENLICRKISRDEFVSKFYYSVGGTNINDDYKRLYCEDFINSDYKPKDSDPRLAKIIKSTTADDENFINSQFIALITGVPDFLLRGEKFKNGEDVFRSSIDYTWTKWAKNMSDNFTRELFFEEPLLLEMVERGQYNDFRSPDLKIAFDINLGEFDRINQRAGKLKVAFKISVQNSFMNFYRKALKDSDYKDTAEKARLKNRFKMQLTKDVNAAREKFLIPPWKGDLEGLIATEITSQILDTPEKYLDFTKSGSRNIEVEINYGVFALKYINHQLNVQKSQEKNKVPKAMTTSPI
ncbi:MAG: hypothetical protein H7336_09660 [Bacteriovorax sp.]|nr:hypothetical protein [Bacteriovorax sp.]